MHRRYKTLANRFPIYRPWFIYINHCIRNEYTQFKADQLVNRISQCIQQPQISISELAHVLMYMEDQQLVTSQTVIRRLEDDQMIGAVDGFAQLESVYKGRTILLDKNADIEQLPKPIDQYAYLSVIYTFKDIYVD